MKISFELEDEEGDEQYNQLHAEDVISIIKDCICTGFQIDADAIKNLKIE